MPIPQPSTPRKLDAEAALAHSRRYRPIMRTPFPSVVGTVERWHGEDGWGVLRTPDGLSVFCHLSHVEVRGQVELTVGSSVWFDYETPGQDGCDARVLTAARPGVADPDIPLGTCVPTFPEPSSSAYRSRLTITYDDGGIETFDDA
jgi:cold shock CspA family protein